MYFLGCDPDLHSLSVAVVTDTGKLHGVLMCKSKGKKKEEAVVAILRTFAEVGRALRELTPRVCAVAVESQDVGYTGRTNNARRQDLIYLAQVVGGVVVELSQSDPCPAMYMPKPQEWKGSVPKKIHQCRVLSKLGIETMFMGRHSAYPVPVDYTKYVLHGHVTNSDWLDITDSVGLAVWAREQWLKEQGKRR